MENYKLFNRAKSILGAPINSVELSDEQLEDILDISYDTYFLLIELSEIKHKYVHIKDFWIEQYFIALCKEALGRVRGKFDGDLPVPGATLKFNYKDLLEESENDKRFLRYLILKDRNILTENVKPILAAYIETKNFDQKETEELIKNIKQKINSDDLIKYFIPIRDGNTRIECIYPINGIDDSTKTSIANIEKLLIEMTEENGEDE